MKRFVLAFALSAGAAQAQQGTYVTLPQEAKQKPSTMVEDVARAYAAGQAQAQAPADAGGDPGRPPSVVEVSPGVIQFDAGVPPTPAIKLQPTQPNATVARQPAQALGAMTAPAESIRSIAPPEWRIGLYGGARPSGEGGMTGPGLFVDVPVPRAVATLGAPLVAAFNAAETANAASVTPASALAAQSPPIKGQPAAAEGVPIPPKLPGWPKVR
jgi:hypothetical protein